MGTRGRYSITLFREGGEGSGIEAMIDSDDRLDMACEIYGREIMKHPGRLVMLCDRSHVLARSDRPKTISQSRDGLIGPIRAAPFLPRAIQ